jgi:predicted ATPase/transcriptional regulator with XRE-family HTH domain
MFGEAPFGRWLKEYRKQHDLTRAELARRIGCSPETIHKIEIGERRPSRQIAELLAEYVHITPGEHEGFVKFARGTAPSTLPGYATVDGSDQPDSRPETAMEQTGERPTNLRAPLTRLIGRHNELLDIRRYLLVENTRLLTVTGPPGIGKTRLCLQAGVDLLDSFADGLFFVSLTSVTDAPSLLDALASTLGLEKPAGDQTMPTLIEHLKGKEILLLLDNFEQVMLAAPRVVELLEACPRLRIIVISREALHVRGEQQYPVPPLDLPDVARIPPVEALSGYSAVALFIERARAAQPNFSLDDENAQAVVAICAHLGGIPLSIELIAARVTMLPPQALLERIARGHGVEQLQLLTGGALALPARHRTLRDAIDWSYDLLDEGERKLFARLSIFVDGCTLAAAEAVCDAPGDLQGGAFAGIAALLDKNLLAQEHRPRRSCETRLVMLEVIRQYAAERLKATGETAVAKWQAEYYLALAEAADPQLTSAEQKLWFDRLECDHNNLRAALMWTLQNGEVEMAGRLSAALVRFWDIHSHFTEGRHWLERVLTEFGDELPVHLKADMLRGAGALAQAQGDFGRASELLGKGLVLQRKIGNESGIARSLNNLALVSMDQGHFTQAAELLEESLALRRRLEDHSGIAAVLSNLGLVEMYRSEFGRAVQLFEESLAIRRRSGDRVGCAIALCNMGEASRRQADYARARTFFVEAIRSLEDLDDPDLLLGSLGGLATIAAIQEQPEYAARLFGVEEALRESLGMPLPPVDQEEYARHVAGVRDLMDESTFRRAWAEGRSMTIEEAVRYAVSE